MSEAQSLTAGQVAEAIGGVVLGDRNTLFFGFSSAKECKAGDLTFAESAEFFDLANSSVAAGILVSESYGETNKVLIKVNDARVGFARTLPLFFPERKFEAGVDTSASVAAGATVSDSAHIGPGVVIMDGTVVGDHCVIQANCVVGENCRIGNNTHFFPNVSVYAKSRIGADVRIHSGTVVGSDGFGYVFADGEHLKIPQVGGVEIGDGVEIGANVTIDRGALGDTVISEGCRIDNLVQIAHNVRLGKYCIVVAQVGIAGSTVIGDYTTLAGQVGIAGHLKIGSRVTVAAQSGVMHNIPDGERWLGSPAQDHRRAKRQLLAIQQLPELMRTVKGLRKPERGA